MKSFASHSVSGSPVSSLEHPILASMQSGLEGCQHRAVRINLGVEILPLEAREKELKICQVYKKHSWKLLEKEGLSKSFILILSVSDPSQCPNVLSSLEDRMIENVWEGFIPVDVNFASLDSKVFFLTSISMDQRIHILKFFAQIWGTSYVKRVTIDQPFKFVNLRLPEFHQIYCPLLQT